MSSQTETLQSVKTAFNAAIDFAISQGIEAATFLDAWRHGDTSEWPEFVPPAVEVTPKQVVPVFCLDAKVVDQEWKKAKSFFHTEKSLYRDFASAITTLTAEQACLAERTRAVDVIEGRASCHNGPHLLTLELNQLAQVVKSGLSWADHERSTRSLSSCSENPNLRRPA